MMARLRCMKYFYDYQILTLVNLLCAGSPQITTRFAICEVPRHISWKIRHHRGATTDWPARHSLWQSLSVQSWHCMLAVTTAPLGDRAVCFGRAAPSNRRSEPIPTYPNLAAAYFGHVASSPQLVAHRTGHEHAVAQLALLRQPGLQLLPRLVGGRTIRPFAKSGRARPETFRR